MDGEEVGESWRSHPCTSNTVGLDDDDEDEGESWRSHTLAQATQSGWMTMTGMREEVVWMTPGARALAQTTQEGWLGWDGMVRRKNVERIQMMDEMRCTRSPRWPPRNNCDHYDNCL